MALHRKVHLFDIDIPGKITFKVRTIVYSLLPSSDLSPPDGQESETLTGGDALNYFDTGSQLPRLIPRPWRRSRLIRQSFLASAWGYAMT